MRYLVLLSVVSIASLSFAQIVPSASSPQFPGCALACTTLLFAEQLCKPPNQPANTQLAYETCFCQSSQLSPFYTTPELICAAECSIPADRVLLQAWYTSFCAQVAQGIDPLTVTPTITIVTSYVTAGTATATAAATNTAPQGSAEPTWIESHWKWVVMICVLAVAFVVIAIIGVWLKKRHRRRLEEKRARTGGFPTMKETRMLGAQSATSELWGPHQHMHATEGYAYTHNNEQNVGSAITGKSKRRERPSSVNQGRPRETNDNADEIMAVNESSRRSRRERRSRSSRNGRLNSLRDRP